MLSTVFLYDTPRNYPTLEQVVEEFGDSLAKLRVVEIPDGAEWDIDEYDGIEFADPFSQDPCSPPCSRVRQADTSRERR